MLEYLEREIMKTVSSKEFKKMNNVDAYKRGMRDIIKILETLSDFDIKDRE